MRGDIARCSVIVRCAAIVRRIAGRVRLSLRRRLRYYKARLKPYRPVALVVLHPDFTSLLPTQTEVVRLATGFRFVEGPVWLAEQKHLLFTDIPANKILCFTPECNTKSRSALFTQNVSVYRHPSGHANGQALDLQGQLISCEHSNRRVTRTDASGQISVLADSFNGEALNSPNDLVMSRLGHLYFTDPPYGIAADLQRQPVQGVYRLDAQTGILHCEIDDIVAPNGLVFSPDERILYVVDSSDNRDIKVFDVDSSGGISGGKLFASCRTSSQAGPDGLTVDDQGNVYCAAAGGVWVFNAAGVHLGIISLPETPSNCTWGGAGSSDLYITAQTSLYRVSVCTNRNKKPVQQ